MNCSEGIIAFPMQTIQQLCKNVCITGSEGCMYQALKNKMSKLSPTFKHHDCQYTGKGWGHTSI